MLLKRKLGSFVLVFWVGEKGSKKQRDSEVTQPLEIVERRKGFL